MRTRFTTFLLSCLIAGSAQAEREKIDPKFYTTDLAMLFKTLEHDYAYRHQKHLDWTRLEALAQDRMRKATTDQAFVRVLEEVLDATYDPHNMLNTNLKDSWRPLPHDVWAEPQGQDLIIRQVRPDSAASRGGIKPGQILLKINDVPVDRAIQKRMPAPLLIPDPNAERWAILSALGGARGTPRRFEVREHGQIKTLLLPDETPNPSMNELRYRALNDKVGLIQIPSFTRDDQVKAFDKALETFRKSKAIIIDVRNNTGGDTSFAKPMMGRLIKETRPYAFMGKIRDGVMIGSSREEVEARGPWTYEGRVYILMNHFSISMAEGFAMGLKGLGRATLVGSSAGGLGAAIERYDLPGSKIPFQISREPVFQLNGDPREALRPDVVVDDQPDIDAALAKALELATP